MTDLRSVLEKMLVFGELSEPAEIARETAGLVRLLEPLANNINLNTPMACEAPPGFLSEMSAKTGDILSSLTSFLIDLQAISVRLVTFCTKDTHKFNRDSITAVGDLMGNLGDLYGALGDSSTGQRFRYGQLYTDKVTVGTEIFLNNSSVTFI